MIRNFFINCLFKIPVWFLRIISPFDKVERNYAFDHQSKLFLSLVPNFNIHEVKERDVPKIRKIIEKRRTNLRLSKLPKKRILKIDHKISKSKKLILREYVPYKTDSKKVILYFHGGGYVLNSIETHDNSVAYFSEKLRTKIYSLDYSKSPENKFPVAHNEGIEAIHWLNKNGIDTEDISLCGDSAGAHLAASISQYLSASGSKNVHSQLLIYPMCDPKCNSESQNIFEEGYFLTNNAIKWFWKQFMNNKDNSSDERFNLLLFDSKNKLPSTIIVTAGFDPLSDEAEEYAYLLHKNNNYVKQLHYPSLFHGFASMTRLKNADKAVCDFLSEYKRLL